MSDLWTEASRDIEQDDADRLLVTARLDAAPLLPFLAAAKSPADFDLRVALAENRLITATGDRMLAAQVIAQVRAEMQFQADGAGGAYYVVDEATGANVGTYPDQSAADQAAAGNTELEVTHTPTGNPNTPGLSQGGPDAASSDGTPDGTPGGDIGAPAAQAPDSAAGMTPPEAPSGAGDSGEDDTSDSDDPQFPQPKTSVKVGSFHVALQEGEDPLLPLLQLLDPGQGEPEVPSYHTEVQQLGGAQASKVNNPFAKQASGLGWPATHTQGKNPFKGMPSGTWPHDNDGPVSVPKGLHKHIAEGENIPRYVGETLHKFNSDEGTSAGPFKVGEQHHETVNMPAKYHPDADSGGNVQVNMPATVLGVHSEKNGRVTHHKALVRRADGGLDTRSHAEHAPAPDYKEVARVSQENYSKAHPGRSTQGQELGLR